MSVIVKGMEMPKDCYDCPLHDGETGTCNILGRTVCDYIPKECPLVEVVQRRDRRRTMIYAGEPMPNKEAIKILKNLMTMKNISFLHFSQRLAVGMAIKALKKESGNNPITNADKIRQMSDDELAEFLAKQEYKKPTFDGWLPLCNHVMGDRICHKNGCRKCWLDWLKEEEE